MHDFISALIQIITAAGALIGAIGSLVNRAKIHEIHVLINDRVDQLLTVSKRADLAQGRQDERDEQAARDKGKVKE